MSEKDVDEALSKMSDGELSELLSGQDDRECENEEELGMAAPGKQVRLLPLQPRAADDSGVQNFAVVKNSPQFIFRPTGIFLFGIADETSIYGLWVAGQEVLLCAAGCVPASLVETHSLHCPAVSIGESIELRFTGPLRHAVVRGETAQ